MQTLKSDFNKTILDLKLSKENLDNRKSSLNFFLKEGLPGKKKEDWKFSDLQKILTKNIKNLRFFNNALKINIKYEKILKKFDHNKIIYFNENIADIDFSFENKNKIKIKRKKNSKLLMNKINSLIYLNHAFLNDYINIEIEKNYNFKKPLIIYHFVDKNYKSQNINQRIDIKINNNSSLVLINLYDENKNNNFVNKIQKFYLCENSILKLYSMDLKKTPEVKYIYTDVDQEKNSLFEKFVFSSGSQFSKNEVHCNLRGKYSSAFINGIIKLSDDRHHELRTIINHLSENTKSYQLIKGILNVKSKGVYQGKIFVDKIAQKTDGYQLSKALLLKDEVEFDAKPELEIYADDVKCSHGSTSGNLDEDSIFYLMSRGLSKNDAKKILIEGFMIEVVEKITDENVKTLFKNILNLK